jgi:hypothetical protein
MNFMISGELEERTSWGVGSNDVGLERAARVWNRLLGGSRVPSSNSGVNGSSMALVEA